MRYKVVESVTRAEFDDEQKAIEYVNLMLEDMPRNKYDIVASEIIKQNFFTEAKNA